jgi:hypothetical protein
MRPLHIILETHLWAADRNSTHPYFSGGPGGGATALAESLVTKMNLHLNDDPERETEAEVAKTIPEMAFDNMVADSQPYYIDQPQQTTGSKLFFELVIKEYVKQTAGAADDIKERARVILDRIKQRANFWGAQGKSAHATVGRPSPNAKAQPMYLLPKHPNLVGWWCSDPCNRCNIMKVINRAIKDIPASRRRWCTSGSCPQGGGKSGHLKTHVRRKSKRKKSKRRRRRSRRRITRNKSKRRSRYRSR